MSPLEAKRINYIYEVGNFIKKQFPDLDSWRLEDPEENILRESYFYVLVKERGHEKKICITNTNYIISFEIVGENKPVSIDERVQKWISNHANELMSDGSHFYSLKDLDNDTEFIEALLEEIAQKGYDAIREKNGIKVEKITE